MNETVKICKIHGQLTLKETIINRISPKGVYYYRCRKCRNLSELNRINKTKYLYTPRKHLKNKLPDFVKDEDKSHAYTILHRFKLTAGEYYSMLEEQNNVCAICKLPETQLKKKSNKIKMLSVDHCHLTGRIRGLLCHHCNAALGLLKDSIEILNSATTYLLSFEH